MSPSASTPISFKGFPHQFICSDDEYTIGLRIGDVDDSKVSTSFRLPDRNPRIFFARPILAGLAEDILNLVFPHLVVVNMRKSGLWIDVKAHFYLSYLKRQGPVFSEQNSIDYAHFRFAQPSGQPVLRRPRSSINF
jgi:hypothetical protein